MKFNKFCLAVSAVAICLAASHVNAQTTNAVPTPPTPQNFVQSVGQYFTSANTNYSWDGDSLEIAARADYLSGNNWAAGLNVQSDLGAYTQNAFVSRIGIDADIRNAGIAGTIVSLEAGAHYMLAQYYSVKVQAGVDIGYDFNAQSPIVEPDLGIRSKLSENTFAGVRVSLPLWTHGAPVNRIPDIGVETGFTWGGVEANGAHASLRTKFDHSMTALRRRISPSTRF